MRADADFVSSCICNHFLLPKDSSKILLFFWDGRKDWDSPVFPKNIVRLFFFRFPLAGEMIWLRRLADAFSLAIITNAGHGTAPFGLLSCLQSATRRGEGKRKRICFGISCIVHIQRDGTEMRSKGSTSWSATMASRARRREASSFLQTSICLMSERGTVGSPSWSIVSWMRPSPGRK